MSQLQNIVDNWDKIINTMQNDHEISKISMDAWIRPLIPCHVTDTDLYILTPNLMGISYLDRRYSVPFRVAVAELTGIDYDIRFVSQEQLDSMHLSAPDKKESSYNNVSAAVLESHLNPNYTFDTFVVGNNNRFAHSAAVAVAETPGRTYNPLYIYGGPGLGKTHLMHSIGHYILQQKPDTKVIYVTSEDFTNEVIEGIRNGNSQAMVNFRDKYRKVDVLMVDDIQFIIGKDATQEEFFHTFNALHTQGKQIILTSDKPPKDMDTLEERMRSRFDWGLMADIGFPEYETRMAILRKKAEHDHFQISDDILDYIANHIKSNIRELEGALNKLIAFYRLEHTPITLEIAERELSNIITPDKPKEITTQLIIEVVSEHFHISLNQLISKSRSNDIAKPRQIAMYLCKNMTSDSLDLIGKLLGGRDHTTVLHGVRKIEAECENNEATRNLIDTIKKKINPN